MSTVAIKFFLLKIDRIFAGIQCTLSDSTSEFLEMATEEDKNDGDGREYRWESGYEKTWYSSHCKCPLPINDILD